MEPNVVPVGASPNEVADDVPIMASENEYIIPANVVRFLGLDKIEKMVNKANEQLEALNQGGRIGGEPMLEEPAPEMAPTAPQSAPVGMAEGGMVSAPTESGIRLYTSPTGETMYVPFLNGNPLYPIPEGYTSSTPETNTAQTQNETVQKQPAPQNGATGSGRERAEQNRPDGEGGAKPIQEWTTQDFVRYGDQLGGLGEKAVNAIGAMIPGGRQLVNYGTNQALEQTPQYLDSMIESGLDLQGNPLSQEDLIQISNTREKIRDRVAADTGEPANPFEKLTSFVKRTLGFGEAEQATPSSSNGVVVSDPSTHVVNPNASSLDREGHFGFAPGSAEETRAVTQNILNEYDKNNPTDDLEKTSSFSKPSDRDITNRGGYSSTGTYD